MQTTSSLLAGTETDGARARVKKHAAGLTWITQIAQFVDAIHADEIFTCDNGMLRPDMKLDRNAATYGQPATPAGRAACARCFPAIRVAAG